jgi:hypothetical protein
VAGIWEKVAEFGFDKCWGIYREVERLHVSHDRV